MAKPKGRKTVIVSGLALLSVLGLFPFYWREMVVQYHLLRLGQESQYFLAISDRPEGTLERMALDLFLKTKKGKGCLLNAFVAGMFELLKEKHKRHLDQDLGTNEA